MAQRLGTREQDDLDALLAEADGMLSASNDDDLSSALAEADALLASPAPAPAATLSSPRRSSPAAPAPPAAIQATPGRLVPGARAPQNLTVMKGGRPTLPAGASGTDLEVIASSPASRSLETPNPWRRPRAPNPPGGAPTLLERIVDLPSRLPGAPKELAKGVASGLVGTGANTAALLTSGAFAKDAEEARRLSAPAQYAREHFSPDPSIAGDVLDEPGLMLDPQFWSYMGGQLAGSVASLAGTGSGGRMVGQAAASRLAARAPALAAKLAKYGGEAAATAGEALVEASDVYQTSLEQGKTTQEAADAAARTFAGNAVLLGLSNHPLFEAGGRGFRRVVKQSLSEATQEGGQQVVANVATGQDALEGIGTATLMGGIGGPVVGSLLAGRPNAPAAPAPVAPDAAATPPPDLRTRLQARIDQSRAAREASRFAGSPAASVGPNADLDQVLAEADTVLEQEAPPPTPAPPVVEPPAPARPPMENQAATRPPQWRPPAVDFERETPQTGADVAGESGLGEGVDAPGRAPGRSVEDFGQASRRSQREQDAHVADAFDAILADARAHDPEVDPEEVRREFDARLDFWREHQADAREQGADPRTLLLEIARRGGIYEAEGGQTGELRRMREGQGFGNIGGIPGVLATKPRQLTSVGKKIDGKIELRQEHRGGLPLDVMLQDLQADGRFPWLQDINDLTDFLDDVQRHGLKDFDVLPGTGTMRGQLGMAPGSAWWRDRWFEAPTEAPPVEDAPFEGDAIDTGEPADVSFDVGSFDTVLAEADTVLADNGAADAFDPSDLETATAEADELLDAEEAQAPRRDERGPNGWRVPSPRDTSAIGRHQLGDRVLINDPAWKYSKKNPSAPQVVATIVGPDPKSANRLQVQLEDGTRTFYNVAMPVQPADSAPTADTLDTGEQQTRLPGEVGAVRDEERAQPTETVPQQTLQLTAEEAPKAQGTLDHLLSEADSVIRDERQAVPADDGARMKPETYTARVDAAPDAHVSRYVSRFGRTLNADNASELFDEYAESPDSRAELERVVRPAASKVVNAAFDRLLSEPTPEGHVPVVLFTSGGNAAGKSTAVAHHANPPHVTLDSTLSQTGPSAANIEKALAAGKDVQIQHVSRNPIQAWKSVLQRAATAGQGRMVSIIGHIQTHAGARSTLIDLADRYAGNPRVHIEVFENRASGARRQSVDWLRRQEYPTGDVLRVQLEAELDAAHAAGRVSDAAYAAARRGIGARGAGAERPAQPAARRGRDQATDALLDDDRGDTQGLPSRRGTLGERLQAMRAARPGGQKPTMRTTGPARPAPGTVKKADTPKNVRPTDLVRDMAKLFEVPVGIGRLGGPYWGWYTRKSHLVRTKIANDLPVLMHEFGHASERHFALALNNPAFIGELMRLGRATSLPSYTPKQVRAEGMAEFFRLWVLDPNQAQRQAPAFYASIEQRLDEMGQFGKDLRALQKRAQAYVAADPETRIALRIDFDGSGTQEFDRWFERAQVQWTDDLYWLKRATEAMAGGAPLPAALSAYVLARNARGSIDRAADFLQNGVRDVNGQFMGPALSKALRPVSKDLARFATYLVAKRATELQDRRIETGITRQEAAAFVREIEHGPEAAAFTKARDQVYEFQTAMLNYAREAGLISAPQQKAMQRLNQSYVPFQRVMDADTGPGTGRKLADRLSPVKRIKGSGRDIINPLESIIGNAYAIVDAAEKNRAMQALAAQADKADERNQKGTGSGQWLRRIQDPQQVTGVKLGEVLLEAAERSGATYFDQQGRKVIPPELDQMMADLNMDPDMVLPVFQSAFKGPKGERIVTVLKDGKRQFYQVEHEGLYDAVTQIAPATTDTVKLFQLATGVLRAGATLTTGFIARNPARDSLSAFLQSRHGFIPVYDTVRGTVKTLLHELGLRHDEDVALFFSQGVTQATLVGTDRATLRKKIRHLADPKAHVASVVLNPLSLLQAISAYSEVATRVGEFSLALRQGGARHSVWQRVLDRQRQPVTQGTLAEATLAARDVTTDFARAGRKSRELNHYAAFFNARVQGYVRIAETIRTQPKTVAFNLGAMMLAAVILKGFNDDDEDYAELAEWEKLAYWHWRPPGADFFVRIPKPFEWAFAPNLAESAVDYAKRRDPAAWNLVKAQMKDNARQFGMGLMPTLLLPSLEAAANYSMFRQRNIVNPWDLDLPLEQQAGEWTTETAKLLTRLGLPMAPAKIDHWLFGHTAGLGRTAVQGLLDPTLRAFGVAPPARVLPAGRWEDVPFAGAYLRSAAPRSDAETLVEFYTAFREMTGATRGVNRAKADPAQRQRILDSIKDLRWRGRESAMREAKKRLDDIGDQVDAVYADQTMAPDRKAQTLDRLRRQAVHEARTGLGYTRRSATP